LFAATEVLNANGFETEAGRTVPQDKYPVYFTRYHTRFLAQLRKLSPGDLAKIHTLEIRDAWNMKLRVENVAWDPRHLHYLVRSAGPDKRFDTADDQAAYLEVRARKIVDHPELKSIDLNIEHDHGPINGFAEIVGSVIDPSGAVIPKAMAEVREVSAGKARRASANAAGEFSLAGLPAGDYEVRVSSPGFQMASRQFRLVARDRAVLSVVLQVGAVTEMVVLDGAAGQRNMGAGGGVAGGLVLFEQMGLANKVARFARTDGAHLGTGSPAENEMALLTPSAGLTVREQTGVSPAAHVRSYFPEALYINPQIITDQNGAATISIPLADSITTWRMAMMASTIHGALGRGTASLKVFQGFLRRPRSATDAHPRRPSRYSSRRVQQCRRKARREIATATGRLVFATR